MAKEIGKDLGRGLATAGKSGARGLAQVVCKASYPILGNLSHNLQGRIQHMVGENYYDAEDATTVSYISNLLVYNYGLASLYDLKPTDTFGRHMSIAFFGSAFALIEGAIRWAIDHDEAKKSPLSSGGCASLAGKLVSLPFDLASYSYDAAKKYLRGVKERVDLQERYQKRSPNLEVMAQNGEEGK